MIASRTSLGLLRHSTRASTKVLATVALSTWASGCLGPELGFAPEQGSGGGTTASTTATTTATTGTGGSGGAGSTTGTGGSGGAECASPEDCPDTGSFCVARTCEAEQCGTENLPADTALPSQDVGDCVIAACDGDGGVVEIVDDSDIPDDFNDCTVDACSAGEPSNDPEPLDTPCGVGGELSCDGAGQCTGCVDPGQCAGTDDDCKARTCEAGVCGVDFTADGVETSEQTPGDCQLAVCDGAGNAVDEIDDGDVADDLNDCTIESCDAGVPGSSNEETGIPCGEGPTCDDSGAQTVTKAQDFCNGFGTCVAQAEETCPVVPQCSIPVCDGLSCGDDPSAIDTPCDFQGTLDGFCDGLGACAECNGDLQCDAGEVCDLGSGTCEATCSNGAFDGDETDTDCGGSCPDDCGIGEGCLTGSDCQTSFCAADLTCASARLVFVTAAPVFADMGGLAGADATCQTLATNAGLSGTYRAWLSDGSGASPSNRFIQSSVPYRLRNGAIVASGWIQLTSGVLQNGITIDQNGASVPGAEVWTGTTPAGTSTGDTCADWSSLAGTGGVGLSSATDAAWTSVFSQFCNRDNVRLYCFQQ